MNYTIANNNNNVNYEMFSSLFIEDQAGRSLKVTVGERERVRSEYMNISSYTRKREEKAGVEN